MAFDRLAMDEGGNFMGDLVVDAGTVLVPAPRRFTPAIGGYLDAVNS